MHKSVSFDRRQLDKAILLFDGQCPLCLLSVAWLQRLDWLDRVHYQNARETNAIPTMQPPLQQDKLLEEIHLVTANKQSVYHGFGAFRWLSWRMPLLWIVAPLLYLPGVPWLGQKIYMWVARNRYKLVPCKDGVCHLPPRPVK